MTVTCRNCRSAVDVPVDDAARLWAQRGAHLWCDGCSADLGPLQRVLEFVAPAEAVVGEVR